MKPIEQFQDFCIHELVDFTTNNNVNKYKYNYKMYVCILVCNVNE